MDIRIWKFGVDDGYINSFLDGMALAHNEDRMSSEWFHWKFEQSPYGKSILACAFDENTVAGCVAYGKGIIEYCGKRYSCALSYETYVHPDYQGKGLFKKLISLAEEEAKCQGVQFLYNFPNENSLTGFKHMGWVCRNDLQQYQIRLVRPMRTLFHIKDLRKPFIPQPSNLIDIKSTNLDDIKEEHSVSNSINPIWTNEYLRWRFFTFPNRRYYVVNNNMVFSIVMVGNRGNLVEAHILYIQSKLPKQKDGRYIGSLIDSIRKDVKPDIVSYRSTAEDGFFLVSRYFFKVPTHSNFCYKVLSDDFPLNSFKMLLPSINAHTY